MWLTDRCKGLLEEQRSFAGLKLAEILIAGINDGIGMCVHRCGWSSKHAYAYLKLLERQNLWPTHLLCISEAIELAEKMPDPIPEEPSIACTYEYKHAAPEYRRNRRDLTCGKAVAIGFKPLLEGLANIKTWSTNPRHMKHVQKRETDIWMVVATTAACQSGSRLKRGKWIRLDLKSLVEVQEMCINAGKLPSMSLSIPYLQNPDTVSR